MLNLIFNPVGILTMLVIGESMFYHSYSSFFVTGTSGILCDDAIKIFKTRYLLHRSVINFHGLHLKGKTNPRRLLSEPKSKITTFILTKKENRYGRLLDQRKLTFVLQDLVINYGLRSYGMLSNSFFIALLNLINF